MENLLCDFHIHTTYSDGKLPMRRVVDLFGRSGHDVIAITDHIADTRGVLGRAARWLKQTVTRSNAREYFDEIASEAKRAWREYRMVVLPGAEITRNAAAPDAACHILALGITEYLSADRSPLQILRDIRSRGALSVACHPQRMSQWIGNTYYLWNRRVRLADWVDRWELACRWDVFPAVARAGLPAIANGDFHHEEHLYAWKTVVPAERKASSVLETLRSPAPLAFTQLTPEAVTGPLRFPSRIPAPEPVLA